MGVILFAGCRALYFFTIKQNNDCPINERQSGKIEGAGMGRKFDANSKRILICEDERDFASSLRSIAEQAGLSADIAYDVTQAKKMLSLGEYAAMTLNLTLHEQDGIALLRGLRAAKHTASLPILVISSIATELSKELSVEAFDVIDWIDKPVNPAYLDVVLKQIVTPVSDLPLAISYDNLPQHAPRDMAILDLSLPDNSGGTSDHLGREIARAKRKRTPLSLAMIDIDRLQEINDSYGYSTGERVIQALLRLLKQRLRQTDLVGRHGGEELAVILCDTDGATAVTVLNKIREEFSMQRHRSDGKEFFVTFSCGIADVSRFDDAIKLDDAAAKSLHKAKNMGQNRIVLA